VKQLVASSSLATKYAEVADRESAYEKLQSRLQQAPGPAGAEPAAPAGGGPAPSAPPPPPTPPARVPKEEPGLVEQVVSSSAFKSAMRSAGTVIGREITRSIFGTARRRR
jgi:hypothetical protein